MRLFSLPTAFAKFIRDHRANIAWIYALAVIPITVAAGATIDVISALDAKTALQDAIDAAALAGANANNSASVGSAVFAAEPLSKFGVNGTPTFTTNNDSSFTGMVTATVATKILPLIGINTLTVSASATAKLSTSSSTVCILILNKTNTQTLLMNSGADIEATKCEVHVATTGSPAAIFNSGTKLNTQKTCLAGTSIIDNGGSHPNLATGCKVVSDPYAGQLPTPSTANCDYNNWSPPNNATSFTMSPGVYCGWVNFNNAPTVTFNPGTYIIKNGGWNVNGGTWNGNGVTFYFADQSKIQFNSGVSANLSAPTSGTYSGILMYEAAGLSQSQFVFDDSKGHSLNGLIYLPSRQMTMNAGTTNTSDPLTMVVDSLIVNTATWTVIPAASKTIAGSSGVSGGAYLVR